MPVRIAGLAILMLLFSPSLGRAVPHSAAFEAVKATVPPVADASLRDPAWQRGLKIAGFFNATERRQASYETVAYFLYDDKNLYVAFHCAQHGLPIVATQNLDNAGMTGDDHVAVWIDTSGNGSRTYSFLASPRGVHDEQASENARYAPRWQSLAQILPTGDYNVVMIIPLRVLRMQHTPVQHWRMNFERYIAAKNDDYTWAYESTLRDVTSAQYWPVVSNISIPTAASRPQPRADVFAFESLGSQRNVFQNGFQNGNPAFTTMSPRLLGVDAAYPFTDTLALVGTLDPDFSNVEQDQATIAPQAFRKLFTEYRPFFAEGAGYINSLPQVSVSGGVPNTPFYTPAIGIFNRGLKIEGTAGRNSIGALNAIGPGLNDSAFGYAYQQPDNALTLSAEGVFARHPDLLDNVLALGVAHTNPHSGATASASFATESGTEITDAWAAHSLVAGGGIQNNHYNAFAGYADIGPQFNPVDGFTQFNDLRGPLVSVAYYQSGSEVSRIKRYHMLFVADRYIDRTGQVREADVFGLFDMDFKNLLTLHASAGPTELRFYNTGFPIYSGGQTLWFNRRMLGLGYKEDSASPTTISYQWGPFDGYYVQQWNSSATRSFGLYGVSLEYDANIEHAVPGGPALTSQWLRRISLTRSFGRDATLAIGLRSINGLGGFAEAGTNLALSFQQRFANEDRLYVVYGTPAAAQTLHRFILKYVFHAGASTGT